MKEIRIPVPERDDVDEAVVGVVRFFLDSEAKSKIYVFLRRRGASTSREIARGANLYPSSAREALASMARSGVVTRRKLEVGGSGKKPFVYEAISPGELLKSRVGGIESKLNRLLNLDNLVRNGRSISYRRVPYRVRIERVVGDEGEERVLVESHVEGESLRDDGGEDLKAEK